MPARVDLEKIDVFDRGVRAFRIVPAGINATAQPDMNLHITRTENAMELGKLLRERQQRARGNRKR